MAHYQQCVQSISVLVYVIVSLTVRRLVTALTWTTVDSVFCLIRMH